jgi:hypothetical protein
MENIIEVVERARKTDFSTCVASELKGIVASESDINAIFHGVSGAWFNVGELGLYVAHYRDIHVSMLLLYGGPNYLGPAQALVEFLRTEFRLPMGALVYKDLTGNHMNNCVVVN